MRRSAPAIGPRVLLVFPPRWDASAPFPAVPRLTAHLRSHGVAVKGVDLNVELLAWMLTGAGSRALAEALASLADGRWGAIDPEVAAFAQWARLWHTTLARDHALATSRLQDHAPYTTRQVHAAHLVVRRAWQIVDALDYAHGLQPGVPVPHRRFIAARLDAWMAWQPGVIGFSAVSQPQLLESLRLARALKQRGCTARSVAGGAAVTSAFGTRFSDSSLPREMDCVVVGRGEEALMRLLSMMEDGTPWPRRLNAELAPDGEPETTPDYTDLGANTYLGSRYSFPFAFSEGCRWRRCRFCGLYCTPRYRVQSPARVPPQLRSTRRRFGSESFFNSGAELAAADATRIGDAIEASRLRVRWQSMARADDGWTRARCAALKRQGFEYVVFGIESLSDALLERMGKGIPARVQIQALEAACDAGLKPAVSLIFDFPGETLRDLEVTIDSLRPYVDRLFSITLLRFHLDRTSILAAHPDQYGLETSHRLLRCLQRDDVFEVRCRQLGRDPNHLRRAFGLFDRWIYSIQRERSILFTRQRQIVDVGFDVDGLLEGCRSTRESLSDHFTLEAILARHYRLNTRSIRRVRRGPHAGYHHKYLLDGMRIGTAPAGVVRDLEAGHTVGQALDRAGVSPRRRLGSYLSLIQTINALDLLQVLLPQPGSASGRQGPGQPRSSTRKP